LTATVLFLWSALSDERTGLSFVFAAGLASAVFLGSESLGTRDHIFVASYDLQGHGGGVRPYLHTGTHIHQTCVSLLYSPGTDDTGNISPLLCVLSSLAMAVVLSPVYTAVTWQCVYVSQYLKSSGTSYYNGDLGYNDNRLERKNCSN
jgi:hypothetical protein